MVARTFVFVGNCLGLLAWGVFGFQCWHWLRFGSWMPLELWQAWVWLGLPWPIPMNWLGIQEIIIWIFHSGLAISLLFIGGMLASAGHLYKIYKRKKAV